MNLSDTERENPANSCDIVSVGSWLKGIREERGETLDEISEITRIGKTYLEAIEEGAASKLPSLAYTRGFIRLYATHLGLSPDEALAMIKPGPAETVKNDSASLPPLRETKPRSPYRLAMILMVVLTLALASAYMFFMPTKSSRTPQQKSRIETTQQYMAEKFPKPTQEQTLPGAPPVPPPQQQDGVNSRHEGIVLRLRAVSDGKVHIIIDGSVSQEYNLVAGDLVEWKAASDFSLDLENAASVEGELDGKPLQPFGDPGKAAHLLIRQDGIHKE